MAKNSNDPQPTSTPTPTKKKRTNKRIEITNDQLGEIILLMQSGVNNREITKQYKLNNQILSKIREELKKPRKLKDDEDKKLPENYFSPTNIQHRVDNKLYDMGYVQV